MEKAVLSLTPENILTIWIMVAGLYLVSALVSRLFMRKAGG